MFWRRRERREIGRWQQQRLLFRYWDGTAIRSLDPFRAYREILNDKTVDLETIGPLVDKWEEPATTNLIGLICRVFDLERYDDKTAGGLTDAEILNTFYDLIDYLDYVKKKCNLGPTSPEPTASGPST